MPNFKRLTSTSGGAKVDVNLGAVLYITAAQHGSTLHFAVAADGKPFTLAVKEKPDAVHGAPAPSPPPASS